MLLCVSRLLFIISLQYTRCTDQLSVAMEVDGSGFTFHENVSNAEDFTNYFQEYGTIYEQKRMLEDEIRMNSYHEAIMGNAEYFSGKTVLDVGAGTGVLSMWAAHAGASKVYACEYTNMAKKARRLVEHNKLAHVIEVIQSSVEELELPEKVDIIISEWQGMILLRESMMDSVIKARDKFLKVDGSMWPSHASIHVAAMGVDPATYLNDDDRTETISDYYKSLQSWDIFVKKLKKSYGLDYSILKEEFDVENLDYYIHTAHWRIIDPAIIVSDNAAVYSINLKTVTLDEVIAVKEQPFNLHALRLQRLANGTAVRTAKLDNIPLGGIATWFDVNFEGGIKPSVMSTGPANGYTHWGQYALYFLESLDWNSPDTNELSGTFAMYRTPTNPRMYNVHLSMKGGQRVIYDLP